jgi:hypothetical protein
MKRMLLAFLVVAPLIFSGACSDDDVAAIIGEPPPGLFTQLECLSLGLDDVGYVFDGLLDGVIGAINQEQLTQPESADFDCETGAFSAELDRITEDGVIDIFLDGTASEIDMPPGTTDLCDGFDQGERFDANWSVELGPTAASIGDGFGNFNIWWSSATVVSISPGEATFQRDDGCKFEITSTSLQINPMLEDAYPSGVVEVSVNDGALTGSMTFDTSEIAAVSFNYAGTTYNFRINLDTGDPIFD